MTGNQLLSFLATIPRNDLNLDVVATLDLLLTPADKAAEQIQECIEIDTAEVGGIIGGPSRAIVLRHW